MSHSGLLPIVISFLSFSLVSRYIIYPLIPKVFSYSSHVSPDMDKLDLPPNINYQAHQGQKRVELSHNPILFKVDLFVASATMSLAMLTVQLVLAELEGWFDQDSRVMAWYVVLPLLMVLLRFVIPIQILMTVTMRMKTARFAKLIFVAVSFCIWWICLAFFGSLANSHLQSKQTESTFHFRALKEMTLLGVSAMAVLSGIGAAMTPFSVFLKSTTEVKERDIERLVNVLKTTDDVLQKRENKRIQAADADLKDEIEGLQQIKESLFQDLNTALLMKSDQTLRRSVFGRMKRLLQKCFSAYCLYRIISVVGIKFIFMGLKSKLGQSTESASHRDALSVTLAKVLCSVNSSLDEEAVVSQVSFLISGALFFCSFSTVLNTCNSFVKILPRSFASRLWGNLSSSLLRFLIFSELLGIYVLATTLLLRSNLPDHLSSSLNDALGKPLEASFIDSWFDSVFGVACVVALVCVAVLDLFERMWLQGLVEDVFDEESLLEKRV